MPWPRGAWGRRPKRLARARCGRPSPPRRPGRPATSPRPRRTSLPRTSLPRLPHPCWSGPPRRGSGAEPGGVPRGLGGRGLGGLRWRPGEQLLAADCLAEATRAALRERLAASRLLRERAASGRELAAPASVAARVLDSASCGASAARDAAGSFLASAAAYLPPLPCAPSVPTGMPAFTMWYTTPAEVADKDPTPDSGGKSASGTISIAGGGAVHDAQGQPSTVCCALAPLGAPIILNAAITLTTEFFVTVGRGSLDATASASYFANDVSHGLVRVALASLLPSSEPVVGAILDATHCGCERTLRCSHEHARAMQEALTRAAVPVAVFSSCFVAAYAADKTWKAVQAVRNQSEQDQFGPCSTVGIEDLDEEPELAEELEPEEEPHFSPCASGAALFNSGAQ
ncbi:unnamed protein product [Prorocentrum cordatum]|uniref:Uncharacterized protein n=1 Tax=Prorocentrum cordatum TaxID=2364126 RepID=A0ABN9UAR4_9DINO|nr:unnamed protein product [Polarella glacialis]